MLNVFQISDFYFFRKPHGVASTFGKERSFLDYVFVDNIDLPNNSISYGDLDGTLLSYIDRQMQTLNIMPIKNTDKISDIIQNLINIFGKDKEYGLLNRLDNDTGGLLYFAKSLEIYEDYKSKQSQNLLTKFYIAQVAGNPFFKINEKEINIDYPIKHHKFSDDRMICIKQPGEAVKGDGKQHMVSTKISLLDFDKEKNISTLLVSISKGVRHQIRVHLSSIGCPILGDNLYSKYKSQEFLHLWSMGFL